MIDWLIDSEFWWKNDFSLSEQKANDYMEAKWFRYEATTMKFWSSIPFSPTFFFVA